jgi:predicted secreted acid phosphatase
MLKLAHALVAVSLLSACATAPTNLGVLKRELITYYESGGYQSAVAVEANRARAWVELRAPRVTRPAMVLDIDETALSNWPSMRANDFGYFPDGPCETLPRGPCGAHAWENRGEAEALAPVLELYRAARAAGVTVFFITGRREPQRPGTEANLRRAGYTEWGGVRLRPVDSRGSPIEYKSGERARIEAEGYTIIANVGDQPSDLAGGHAERTFLIPNPYYSIP